ncbi:uncharacterized protein LOC115230306 [Octopus sinensis]|uniref:Uncharacterized protein LOC115230306 n=1 Tax=Octopus sinensis TaxID=2607531 RepID=A0A6P7TXA0_9MOLL|nr:uncharacterized protein LOC115230306 [Octopus sinensis]
MFVRVHESQHRKGYRPENININGIPITPVSSDEYYKYLRIGENAAYAGVAYCPYRIRRLHFPLKLSFAMTINKVQGQSLKVVGSDLRTSCFSHGQFYIVCSRAGHPDSLLIYPPEGKTKNVVCKAALQ